MRIGPLPYLLAVATSSNIGSVATITGNPQNMLIGSFSRISYRDFFFHLGPVALVGLFLNWAVLSWLHMRRPGASVPGPAKIPVPAHDPTSFRSRRWW
jgi:Na+/H+ antiporter NhaD/arsenite permease-like protein